MNKIRSAVFGCGGCANYIHLPIYKKIPELELAAVCDISEKLAKKAAEKYRVKRWTTDPYELIRDDKIDMVDIVTQNDTHAPLAIAAARAGKHVLCQKPMATEVRNCQKMIKAAQEHKVKLGIYMFNRFTPLQSSIKEIIKANIFGKVISVRSRTASSGGLLLGKDAWRRSLKSTGGGSLIQLGIHHIDILQWSLGRIKKVKGICKTVLSSIEGEDITVACLEFENGVLGIIDSSYCSYGTYSSIEVFGTEGYLVYIEDDRNGISLTLKAKSPFKGKFIKYQDREQVRVYKCETSSSYLESTAKLIYKDFVSAIKEDGKPMTTGEEGMQDLAVVKAIYESHEKDKTMVL